MNQEILVMTARIKQWDTEINGLQLEINEYKSKLETARAERFDKLIQDKLNNYKAEWNDNLSWLKNEYNRDMESGATQFLLKYSDEKDSDNSSQRRSDQKNWNRQGNNNNNRSGGNFSNRNNSNNWNNNWNNNLEDAKLWLPIQSRPRFGLFFRRVTKPKQNKRKKIVQKEKKEKKTGRLSCQFFTVSLHFLTFFLASPSRPKSSRSIGCQATRSEVVDRMDTNVTDHFVFGQKIKKSQRLKNETTKPRLEDIFFVSVAGSIG